MHKRKLNVKLLVGLLVGCVAFGICIHFLHAFQVDRNAGKLKTVAEQAQARGDLEDAILQLRRYLNLRPTDYESYATLAEVAVEYAKQPEAGRYERLAAYGLLESGLRAIPADDPKVREFHDTVRRLSVEFTLDVGLHRDALDHLEYLLVRNPGDVELHKFWGSAQSRSQDYGKAAERYQELVGYDYLGTKEFHPKDDVDFTRYHDSAISERWAIGIHDIEVYDRLAKILKVSSKSSDMPDRVMNQMVTENPDSFEAYLRRGRYLQVAEDMEGARRDIAEAYKREPKDAQVILAVAELAIKGDDFAKADENLKLGVQEYPEDDRMYRKQVDLALRQQDRDAALAYVAQGLEAVPDSLTLMLLKADLQLQARNVEAVRETIKEMRESMIRDEILAYLEARIGIAEGDWIKASRELEDVRPLMSPWPTQMRQIDVLLGQCYERMAQYDRALDSYYRAHMSDPDMATAKAGLRRMETAVGKGNAPTFQFPKTLSKRRDREIPDMDRIAESGMSDVEKQIARANMFAEQKRFGEAHRLFAQARIDFPKSQRLLDSSLMLVLRDPKGGLKKALALRNKLENEWEGTFPITAERLSTRAVLVMAQDEEKGPEMANKLLDRIEAQFGDTGEVRETRAKLFVQMKGEGLQRKLASLEAGVAEMEEREQVKFWFGIADSYYRARLRDEARRCVRNVEKILPNNLQIRRMLFNFALEGQENEEMKAVIAEIKALNEDTVWRYCEASRLLFLVRNGQQDKLTALAEAQQLIDDAMSFRPEWHELFRIQAELDVQSRRYDSAIENFERSLELGPPNLNAVRQVVQLLTLMGRYVEAKTYLHILPDDRRAVVTPEVQVQIYLSDAASSEQDSQERKEAMGMALHVAQQAVERSPENSARHLLLGQVFVRAEKTEEAEKAFRRAVELDSEQPRPWLALIALLQTQKKTEQAEAERLNAQRSLPSEIVPQVMGQVSEILADFEAAEQYYKMAVDAEPENLALQRTLAAFYLKNSYNKPDKYTKIARAINEILTAAKNTGINNSHVAWARRVSARIMTSRGGHQTVVRARLIIQENAIDGELKVADRLELARILANRPEPTFRRDAIELLQQLHAESELRSPADQLTLARLYLLADYWPECQKIMNKLLARHSTSPIIWATYCKMLMDNDEVNQAYQMYKHLEEITPPDDANTLELKARLFAAMGDKNSINNYHGKALSVLRKTFPRPKDIEKKHVSLINRVARVLTELDGKGYELAGDDYREAAEDLYRLMVKLDPRTSPHLAVFLGKYGKVEEVMDILDQMNDPQQLGAVLQIAINTLRINREQVGDRYDARVQSWFDKAQRDHPGSRGLLIQLALFREVQGQYEEVESIYRKLLERKDMADAERAAVLNNLAFFLALLEKDNELGMKYIEDAIKIVGPTSELLDTRAMIRLSMKDYESAIEDINLSIFGSPSGQKFFHLALAQLRSGDRQAALEALTKAQSLGIDETKINGIEHKKYLDLISELGFKQARSSIR